MGGAEKARHTWQVYSNTGVDFAIVAGRGSRSSKIAQDIGEAEFERRFVVLPPVPEKRDVDIEDLVDRSLYYEAFECTYRHILDRVPPIDEIDGDGGQRRSVNYARWLKRQDMSLDRALVAQRMFTVMLGGRVNRDAPGRADAIEWTAAAFAGLFAAIKSKYGGDQEGPRGPPAPCPGPGQAAPAAGGRPR